MSEDWGISGIPVGQLETAIKSIAKDGLSVLIRDGLEIDTTFGETVILADGKRYEIKDVPHNIEAEVLAAASRHKKAIETLKQSKYLDPATNPMIKVDPDLG